MPTTVVRAALLSISVGVFAGAHAPAPAHATRVAPQAQGLPATVGAADAPARAPSLRQLHHTAWTARDGAPANVQAIAQTRDGYLWVGARTGLYRFDGVRFERFEPPAGQTMPSGNVSTLLVLPGDSLWIGYLFGGASVLAENRLVHYGPREGMPEATVRQFGRDSAGGVWAATQGGLFRRVGNRWEEVGVESGLSGRVTFALLFDRRGTLWVAEEQGVFARPRGAQRFVRRAREPGTINKPGLSEAANGTVWGVAATRGLIQLSDSVGAPLPGGERASGDSSQSLLFDPDGNVWLPGAGGVLWMSRPASLDGAAFASRQKLTRAEGLSGATAWTVFRDREGSIWVGTTGGLDRFRATKLTPALLPTSATYPAIAAGEAGTLWVKSQTQPLLALGERAVEHMPMPGGVTAAHRDLDGGVWLGGQQGTLWQLRGGALEPVPVPAAATVRDVQAIARDRDDRLWLSVQDSGVFRRRAGVWDRFRPLPNMTSAAVTIVADRAGRTWLGYTRDRLARVAGDSVRLFTAEDGLRVGHVSGLHVRGDRVWVGGEFGVMYLDDTERRARFRALVTTEGPIRGVSGIVERADGELWLNGGEGVTRVPAAELRRALREASYAVHAERFDHRDGVDGTPPVVRPLPTAIEGTDGRLWFTTTEGLTWVDPTRLRRNALPPPVHVRELTADGRRYGTTGGRVALPKGTSALALAYTATSLAVPERVRFRYRLVGLDTAWQAAGARREAFYTNLDAGRYRFEVTAANDDGVWNATGAALQVVIPPTFAQSNAFLVLCAVGAGGAAWALAVWRQRRVATALRARFEAVLAERTRVARELHDTLLSELAGLTMRLDAAAARAASPRGADLPLLAELRDQARRALDGARHAVVDMRGAEDGAEPFAEQLREAARRVFADTDVVTLVEPINRPLRYPPSVEIETLRIASEALFNARRHAHCRTVSITCDYGPRELRVRVHDDGRGFDTALAAANGHYGLAGMRERASALGARLAIDSAPGRGTTVLVAVPSSPTS